MAARRSVSCRAARNAAGATPASVPIHAHRVVVPAERVSGRRRRFRQDPWMLCPTQVLADYDRWLERRVLAPAASPVRVDS
jgi:hypothetical protein